MEANQLLRGQHPPLNILSYLIHLKQTKPYPEETLRVINYNLTRLSKHTDLNEPQQVYDYIAGLQCSNNYKAKVVKDYAKFIEYYGIEHKKPHYEKESKPIRLPTHEKLEMLIANAGRSMSIKLQLSMETGLRPIELMRLKVKDIDLEQRLVYPTTAKHGSSRILKISARALLLSVLLSK
jgi:integrase